MGYQNDGMGHNQAEDRGSPKKTAFNDQNFMERVYQELMPTRNPEELLLIQQPLIGKKECMKGI